MFISPEFSCRIIKSFTNQPLPLDEELLGNVTFVDAVGGGAPTLASKYLNRTNNSSKLEKNKKLLKLRKLESYVLPKLLKERKKNKYLKNRQAFFADSKHFALQWWGRNI